MDNQLQQRVEYLEEQGFTVVLAPLLLTCHVVVETLVIFILTEKILLLLTGNNDYFTRNDIDITRHNCYLLA